MADVKWIKITTDMFDNRKIKHLRKLPEGDSIVLIWVMLLTMAGRCNAGGMIFLTENIPYTPKMLADELDFEESTVILALKSLENFNMIVTDNGFFSISGWEEYQNTDRLAEIREYNRIAKQKQRARQKALMESSVCQYCGGTATGYDHIIPRARGGTDDDYNKIPCCPKCNKMKSTSPVADFLNGNLDIINIGIICNNEKLSNFVKYDGKWFRSVKDSQMTSQRCQDTDIDIEEEKEGEEDNSNISPSPKAKKPVKHKYGEYQNVLLTDEELEKIKAEFPDYEERIERLSSYVASTGKSYKSHYATIRNWARKDAEKQPTPIVREKPQNSTDAFMDKLKQMYNEEC